MKRTPLRRQSSKKKAENAARRKLRADLVLQRGPYCEARTPECTGSAHDMHETILRSQGGSATDETNILLVCRSCHTYIHQHPAESYDQGWLRHGWEEQK